MDENEKTAETAPKLSLTEKLKAYKAAQDGNETFTLPGTGVEVALPKFKPYAAWQKAQRLGGANNAKVQEYYITLLCTFDGERMNVGDYRELIPAPDHLEIIGKIFGSKKDDAKEDKDGEGEDTGKTEEARH